MPSTTGFYAPTTIATPDELLVALTEHRRVLSGPSPVFEVPAPATSPEQDAEPATEDERPFWWMPQADTAPDPDGSPIFDQLMFEALAGEL